MNMEQPNKAVVDKEVYMSGEANYLGKAEEYKEELDSVETRLADTTKELKGLEERRDELVKMIKEEEQSRLN